MEVSDGIEVSRVLQEVFENLGVAYELHGIDFSPVPVSEIFFSPHPQNSPATIEYYAGSVLKVKNSLWMLMHGERGGDNPKNFVVNDISLFSLLPGDIEDYDALCRKTVFIMGREGNYFGYSLFYGTKAGDILFSPRNSDMFRQTLLNEVGGRMKDFVFSKTEYELGGRLFNIKTKEPVIMRPALWKVETVPFLFSAIEETLLKFSS